MLSGSGSTTVLNRRFNALDRSLTPLSRSLAVAMTLNPLTACTSPPNSGMGKAFSERMVSSESWTSEGMRVSSSTRAIRPSRIPRRMGLGTSASIEGPLASSRA